MLFFFTIVLLLHTYGSLFAHEGLHEQIAAATKEIHQDPKNAELYLRRGELYRFHHEWNKALADYSTALKLNPQLDTIEYCRAMLYADRESFAAARKHFDAFLAAHPDHVAALTGRARVLVKMKQFHQAEQDYSRAIEKSPEPEPEQYIERTNAVLAGNGGDPEKALQSLDQGIQRLGPIVTLQLPAIDLELKRRNFDAALKRIDTLAAQSERKESWLLRRGQILRMAGRAGEAQQAFHEALTAWESLPENIRETKAGKELEAQIQSEVSEQ